MILRRLNVEQGLTIADRTGFTQRQSRLRVWVARCRARLGDPDAARTLWRLGTPATDLVEPLLAAAADPYGQPDAVTLLVEMRAVTAVPGLVELAERDERVVRYGNMDYVWRDDALRRHLRTAVTVLTT